MKMLQICPLFESITLNVLKIIHQLIINHPLSTHKQVNRIHSRDKKLYLTSMHLLLVILSKIRMVGYLEKWQVKL
jgi:hypothetical protein